MGLQRLSWKYTGSTADYRAYFTPAERFYHVDHGCVPAPIAPESWTLRMAGRVSTPRTYSYADLVDRINRYGITRYVKCLQCLRDPVGDDVEKRWYASSGLWGGLPLLVLLEEVGVLAGSTRIDYGGTDPTGFFSSLPLERATTKGDSLPVLLATELNGAPLIYERGGPVRLIVPDMLGFKSMKWLSWMSVTDGLVPNGWYERGRGVHLPPGLKDPPLKTMARVAPVLDGTGRPIHPRLGRFLPSQPLMFRGYAVAGPRGLAGVRYRVETGPLHLRQPGPNQLVHDGYAALEAPGHWGLPGAFPSGVIHCSGDRPKRWPLPCAWAYWQAWFGPLAPGQYQFTVWALDLEGHEQPFPDPNEHSGSAQRESVVFRVA